MKGSGMKWSGTNCVIHLVAGARPNIVKIVPLFNCLSKQGWCTPRFVWFTQHYTPELSSENFEDLDLGAPDHVVEVSPSCFGNRLGAMISGYTELCGRERPDLVVVAGDVDTSLGAALAAKRQNIPVVHLEAGLRSYDRAMPEEVNRILIDAISDIWLTPSETASQNLIQHEGRPPEQVHFVGNIMIDSIRDTISDGVQSQMLERFALSRGAFGIATFHRPSNVDTLGNAKWIIEMLREACRVDPMLFPMHPRTQAMLKRHGLMEPLQEIEGLRISGPLRYKYFINLLQMSRFIMTDSGGVQEEAAYLGKHCITLRDNTERPITLYCGSNHLVNHDTATDMLRIIQSRDTSPPISGHIAFWDGFTSQRSAHVLQNWWKARNLQNSKISAEQG